MNDHGTKGHFAANQDFGNISKLLFNQKLWQGTKPVYKFMLINSLLAIKLKAAPNGNPTNDFHWMQKYSSLIVVQCTTPSRPIIFYCPNLDGLTGKF